MFSKKFGVVLCILIACLSSRAGWKQNELAYDVYRIAVDKVTSKDYEYVLSFVRELIQKGVTKFDDIRNELGDKIKDFESVYLDMLENEFSFYTKLKSEDTPGDGVTTEDFSRILSKADRYYGYGTGTKTIDDLLDELHDETTDLNEYQKKVLLRYLKHIVNGVDSIATARVKMGSLDEAQREADDLFYHGFYSDKNFHSLWVALEHHIEGFDEYERDMLERYLKHLVNGEDSIATAKVMTGSLEELDEVLDYADEVIYYMGARSVGYLWDQVKNQTEGFDENLKHELWAYLDHLVNRENPGVKTQTYDDALWKARELFNNRNVRTVPNLLDELENQIKGFDEIQKRDLMVYLRDLVESGRPFDEVLSKAVFLYKTGIKNVDNLLAELKDQTKDFKEYQMRNLMDYLKHLVNGENLSESESGSG